MKKALILPLLATCCLGFSSCIFQQQQQQASPEALKLLKENKQWAKDIQRGSRECVSMEWEGELSIYNKATDSYVKHKYTYPVSDEEAATIRHLLTHLHAVKWLLMEFIPEWGHPNMSCTLHFLDAEGKTIESVNHGAIGMDSSTDENGYQYNRCLSLPDADCAEWRKLIPADLQRRYEEAEARWKRENK